jgi:hypothetical protein
VVGKVGFGLDRRKGKEGNQIRASDSAGSTERRGGSDTPAANLADRGTVTSYRLSIKMSERGEDHIGANLRTRLNMTIKRPWEPLLVAPSISSLLDAHIDVIALNANHRLVTRISDRRLQLV